MQQGTINQTNIEETIGRPRRLWIALMRKEANVYHSKDMALDRAIW